MIKECIHPQHPAADGIIGVRAGAVRENGLGKTAWVQ
jgi:hypothetical protein